VFSSDTLRRVLGSKRYVIGTGLRKLYDEEIHNLSSPKNLG
jgi:hypothetical protein